ncbi:MAG: (2Fe-2S)-binding protein [Oscillospiraceae bacterium]|nr:(2Fe-2S)-binding protein [Oscillospiraceae bacterium]
MSNRIDVALTINGRLHNLNVRPDLTLAETLRDELNLTGTKIGCDDSNCGVCTVLLDGMAVKSCAMLVGQADGREITTIEGLETGDGLHPLQQAFIDYFAVQCGFCTPGMILTAKAILDENPKATEEDIREGLHGNLCRCTGYVQIVEAIESVRDGKYGEARA